MTLITGGSNNIQAERFTLGITEEVVKALLRMDLRTGSVEPYKIQSGVIKGAADQIIRPVDSYLLF